MQFSQDFFASLFKKVGIKETISEIITVRKLFGTAEYPIENAEFRKRVHSMRQIDDINRILQTLQIDIRFPTSGFDFS